MSSLRTRIRALVGDFVDQWLQSQSTQRPLPRRRSPDHQGMVMICGPCATKKQAIEQALRN